jgi:hypothetical protein
MSDINESVGTPHYWMLAVWPAFLTACILEGLVFAVVDPSQLHWPSYLVETSRQATYTLAFFCFWLIGTGCSGLTLWLVSSERGNQN